MTLLLSAVLSVAALPGVAAATPAPVADWWWVAGDSRDDAAVFVEGDSVRHDGDVASVTAVRITRTGDASDVSWRGRCNDRHADEEIAAIAQFACGTDDDHMRNAALLGGLSPTEAARAIFSVPAKAAERRIWG